MEKIRKFWQGGLAYWRKKSKLWKIAWIGGSVFLIGLVYLLISLASLSSLELTLARLRASIGGVCHEDCRLARMAWRSELTAAVKPGNRKMEQRIADYLLDSQETIEFKEELLQIYKGIYQSDNLPGYLSNYLQDERFSSDLQVLIFNYFFVNPAATAADVDYYFMILDSQADLKLKQAAIQAISNVEDKTSYFTEPQLNLISTLAQSSGIAEKLRQSLILLLGDYYNLFPEKTNNILLVIYNSPEADDISRYFAADILNRYLLTAEVPEPFISDEEWEGYYSDEPAASN